MTPYAFGRLRQRLCAASPPPKPMPAAGFANGYGRITATDLGRLVEEIYP